MDLGPHVPSQAFTKDVDLYAEVTAKSTRDTANEFLKLLSPLAPGTKIHDNGCGAGEVTSAIMAVNPPTDISIEATDVDPTYLERLTVAAGAKHWPVTASRMAAEDLTFADETFDLSVANFVIFMTREGGVPAVSQMRRTLRPGGSAIFTSWARLPQVGPAQAAHAATRGPDGPPLREIPPEWWRGEHLRGVAIKAGFAQGQTELHTVNVHLHYDSAERLARLIWSWLGPPLSGWLESDEENWDKAIEVILKSFEENDDFKLGPDGVEVQLTANVLIARK
ncbi:hypothetical protein PFICI_09675 [Pestalotiopsis fici W106-1]|uniref:Methyltransferase domain-containing protein n=1 Tax=Pestalotiopsis fici (strain W106-1 / CGMCC3.15140) TaxID=1229662 RepID=W3WUR2_PESFW|nr:uncharacterized protein PFICI_09675 [Pestalotiopsis fici W106-1]ETS77613.1 hypothetical protein PFICI_09675 [Pestalotiopsis fici W106-1]